MIGRKSQIQEFQDILKEKKSAFIAVTGRRRVGKTYLIEQVFAKYMAFKVTGIQDGDAKSQIANFTQKIAEYFNMPFVSIPNNWQETFFLLKKYLQTLPKNKKHVVFFDELPWMNTHKSNFIQLFAHLWNDYISKENNLILIVCGSATSWLVKNIQNDKGGFHNRITHMIHLKPFTLNETKELFISKNIKLSQNAIIEIYMTLGGIPYYLEKIKKGESPAIFLDRLFFSEAAPLRSEYNNLYKSIFENAANHEAVVKALALAHYGLTREELIAASGLADGGNFTRTMDELISCEFVSIENPIGRKKRGSFYRLIDEFSIFHHRFIANKVKGKGNWAKFCQSQSYKIWTGYAFENLCKKHISTIKHILGISGIYTESYSFRSVEKASSENFQIDFIIDRNDNSINLCECKFYSIPFKIDANYAKKLLLRKSMFIDATKTKKNVFTTLITNYPIVHNEHSMEAVDVEIAMCDHF